jgi:hypothetical protein
MTANEILNATGHFLIELIVAGGGGAAIAYLVVKTFGDKWLDHKFKERLENLKHEQTKEIEAARQKVQALFSRISKIHEREFEVLPKAWFLLHEAHGKAATLMTAFREISNFPTMGDEAFEEYLQMSELSPHERDDFRSSADRMAWYQKYQFRKELHDASEAQRIFHNYIIENRIFMTKPLQTQFTMVAHTLATALVEHRLWKEGMNTKYYESSTGKVTGLKTQIEEIERGVQERLHYDSA